MSIMTDLARKYLLKHPKPLEQQVDSPKRSSKRRNSRLKNQKLDEDDSDVIIID